MSYICLKRDIAENEHQVVEGFSGSFILKKQNNSILVAKNECQHRGLKVTDCGGKGPLRCKMHGQRFDFKPALRHHEFGEFIFAPEWLGASEKLTDISTKVGEEFGSFTETLKAPFHLYVQQSMDLNHIPVVHPTTSNRHFYNLIPESVYLSEFESSFEIRVLDETVQKFQNIFKTSSEYMTQIMGFPNLMVTNFLDVFITVSSVKQIGDQSEVYSRFFWGKDVEPNTLLAKKMIEEAKRVFEEDRPVIETWAKSPKHTDVQWMPNETRIKRYVDELIARGFINA